MRKKPIKAKFIGCVNCSKLPNEILEENQKLDPYGVVSLKICGYKEKWFVNGIYKGKVVTPKRIQKKWGKKIRRALWTEISICSTMSVSVYEYDKNTKQWLLVEQYRSA